MAKRLNDDDDTEDPLERFAREPDDPTTGTSKQKKVSDSFTGEQDELIEEYFVEISGSWHRGTKCIIRAAKGCNNANEKLNNFEKAKLIRRLPFDRPTFAKLVKIANDPRIVKHLKHLAPHYSILYEITQLTDEQLKQGIETGIINPSARRSDVESLRSPRRGPEQSENEGSGAQGPNPNTSPDAAEATGRKSKQKVKRYHEADDSEDEFDDEDIEVDAEEERRKPVITFQRLQFDWKTKGRLLRADWEDAPKKDRCRFIKDILTMTAG